MTKDEIKAFEEIYEKAIKAFDSGEEMTGDIPRALKTSCLAGLKLIAALRADREMIEEWRKRVIDEMKATKKLAKELFYYDKCPDAENCTTNHNCVALWLEHARDET